MAEIKTTVEISADDSDLNTKSPLAPMRGDFILGRYNRTDRIGKWPRTHGLLAG